MAFGTLFSLDAVAAQPVPVAEIGEDAIWENLDAYFAAHNLLFNQAAEFIAERTTDRLRQFGATDDTEAQELDEFGQPSVQKIAVPGTNTGFPLRRYGNVLQWTRIYFEQTTTVELARQVNSVTNADERALYRAIRRALFTPTNNLTYADRLVDGVVLPVRALINADSTPIPVAPDGTAFDTTTHTHYTGVTTGNAPTQAEALAAIENLTEHFTTGDVQVYINRAEEADVLAFADFKEYIDARLVDQTAAVVTRAQTSSRNMYDRAIGLLGGAEWHIRPWIPAGYWFMYVTGQPLPLVMRQPEFAAAQNLRLVAEDENYPLRAREWEHRFGFGVWQRVNGVVVDVSTGSTNYTAPTL